MKNAEIVVITLFVLAAAFFAFLYWVEVAAKKKFREMFHAAEHKARLYENLALELSEPTGKIIMPDGGLQDPGNFDAVPPEMFVVPDKLRAIGNLWRGSGDSARVLERVNALEAENATLRSDNETGCKIIDEQRNMITVQKNVVNNLRRQMAQDRMNVMKQKKHK